MTQLADKAGKIREGEQLNLTSLLPWLHAQLPDLPLSGEPQVMQYSGGASNWTYLLQYPEIELILRRAPAGTKAKGAHDMAREFKLQQALKPFFPLVPDVLALCSDNEVIGSEFYVMQKLTGIIPRRNFPRGLELSEQQSAQLCKNALDTLIELHKVKIEDSPLAELGKGEGYIQRQIDGWCQRYTNARSWNVPSGKKIMRWLHANMPADEHICLIHNDFRLDNLVLDVENPTSVIGVLDWELATLGDPRMDLGCALAYWVEQGDDPLAQSTRRQPSHVPGMFTRRELIEYYCQQMGFSSQNFVFYEVYGLFRLAGIAQQIYYRYHHKQTRNPAFKHFWLYVHYLMWRCAKLIKASKTR
ncbi:phosphotransferase family protein [Neptunicella marina]|uniref:Phosphotransferase family protein n=1 Tax=Neptunicella marina TaxID=2125989 RepID=A0A8J6IY33_9ALTE|nr:phosphotransferase family protein [Neptunicella marina]MBC3767427.1 phosphotransferase family protein [Neptunicella marina]